MRRDLAALSITSSPNPPALTPGSISTLSLPIAHIKGLHCDLFNLSVNRFLFLPADFFSSSSSFTSLMHPEGKSSCLHCLSMKISCAAGFVKQLIKDNAINYSLMK